MYTSVSSIASILRITEERRLSPEQGHVGHHKDDQCYFIAFE